MFCLTQYLVLTENMGRQNRVQLNGQKPLDIGSLGPIEQLMEVRESMPLFGGLSDEKARFLFAKLKRQSFDTGHAVFRQGDFSSHIYIVLSGSVRLVFDMDDHPVLKADLRLGDCFGETSVIGIQRQSASAVVAEDTELLVMSKSLLMEIFEKDKELFAQLVLNIARDTCRRLHQTDESLLEKLHQQAFGVVQLPLPGLLVGDELVPKPSIN